MKRNLRSPLAVLAVLTFGCHEPRTVDAPLVYADVQPLLETACVTCHGTDDPAAGYSVASHWEVLGCVPEDRPATLPPGPDAPLVSVLSRPDHATLLGKSDQALLSAWVSHGSPAFVGSVHPAGIVDPRSEDWHGKLAAQDDFAPLHDASASTVCGRCHDGAPVKPEGVVYPAPGATPCTDCHRSERAALACDTCHGNDGAAYPPRETCYFGAWGPDAHAAHVTGTRFLQEPLSCNTCHPTPTSDVFAGPHTNGKVDVSFASLPESSYEPGTDTCAVYCHAQGGSSPSPHWREGDQVECQSCHTSPPEPHYPGDCSTCHAEMGEHAESLHPGALHLNGKVDMGNGSGTCGACHGTSETGAPDDSSHKLHLATTLTLPLACEDCHPTPAEPIAAGHMDGEVAVVLGERARQRGQDPVWTAGTKVCSNVACHGAALPGPALSPAWNDPPAAGGERCETCHASPPPAPHVERSSCGGSLCHADEVGLIGGELRISEPGRPVHIDGVINPPYGL